ncbi:transcription antiterminator [Paraliobacillus sp. JSM ZJ581]|uniref:BglG family transcription antiterminator n=1 Tax=Paraliobacillus sp. JSM ZJ581 TaxID=3342118 RepID=UPI0035A9954E
MSKSKREVLVHYLQQQQDWVNTTTLTELLGVSPRTLRNYISQVNKASPKKIIESSHLGYRWTGVKKESEKMKKTYHSFMKTPSQRMYYLLQQLVLQSEGLDVFDLSDELDVSVPTIEKDLQHSRSILKNFDLQLLRHKDQLTLTGLERNKRKLMSAIYFKEYNTTFYNIVDLEESFGYDLHTFRDKLLRILNHHGLDINEYTIGNILYHIVISIERMKDEQFIEKYSYELDNSILANSATDEVKQLIESYFQVSLRTSEMNYLQSLLASKTTIHLQDNTSSHTNSFIDEKYIALVEKLIARVNESYLVDLNDAEFITKFALHIKNMTVRSASGFLSKNPLTQTIKTSSPLIYDLAVFISNIIMEEENLQFAEDEITYIALHVGSCLELKQHTSTKIKAILVSPEYYDVHLEIKQKLLTHVGNQLVIEQVITQIDHKLETLAEDMEADIMITTLPLSLSIENPIVTISPFVSEKDVKKINQEVDRVKQMKANTKIKQQLFALFDERLFIRGKSFANETEVITYLGGKFLQYEIVPNSFIKDVMKRESMSSTAFNNIVAVPHAMNMNAFQTAIAILIPEQPISWGANDNIRIVSMIAMSQKERKVYREIYDAYIKVLTDPKNVSILSKAPNFQTFIDQLSNLLMKNQD